MQRISLVICADADDAVKQGFDYKVWTPKPKGLTAVKAVLVLNGTLEGNSTVDLIFEDDQGNQYVALITANLLKMVTTAAK